MADMIRFVNDFENIYLKDKLRPEGGPGTNKFVYEIQGDVGSDNYSAYKITKPFDGDANNYRLQFSKVPYEGDATPDDIIEVTPNYVLYGDNREFYAYKENNKIVVQVTRRHDNGDFELTVNKSTPLGNEIYNAYFYRTIIEYKGSNKLVQWPGTAPDPQPTSDTYDIVLYISQYFQVLINKEDLSYTLLGTPHKFDRAIVYISPNKQIEVSYTNELVIKEVNY